MPDDVPKELSKFQVQVRANYGQRLAEQRRLIRERFQPGDTFTFRELDPYYGPTGTFLGLELQGERNCRVVFTGEWTTGKKHCAPSTFLMNVKMEDSDG